MPITCGLMVGGMRPAVTSCVRTRPQRDRSGARGFCRRNRCCRSSRG